MFIPILIQAQPRNNQTWNLNTTLTSDTLTIVCSQFQLPFFLGRVLAEIDSIGSREGELSESLSSPHDIKITLQPETTTIDTLATISGCSVDGTILMLLVADVGDTITITETGNIDLGPNLIQLVRTGSDLPLWFVLRGSTWKLAGGSGEASGGGGNPTTFDYFGATTEGTAAKLGNSNVWWQFFADVSDNLIAKTSDETVDTEIGIYPGQMLRIYSQGNANYLTDWDPAGATPNDIWKINSPYGPLVSAEVPLIPFGNCTLTQNHLIVTNAPPEDWIQCQDAVGDGVSFSYQITSKILSDTTVKIYMSAVNVNVSPTGTFTLSCAGKIISSGAAYTAHDTTGEQPVSFSTFATQNFREVASATFTYNGTPTVMAHVMGQCNVSAAPAQIGDIWLFSRAVIEVFSNSLSD